MVLVDYPSSTSSSSSETDDRPRSALKRKRSSSLHEELGRTSAPPPPPSSFHDLYATAIRASTQDDPSLHGGRKRAVPHAEGNWPSHLYLEWYPNPLELEKLCNLLSTIQTLSDESSTDLKLQSLLISPLSSPLPLHISLSAPLVLRTEQKAAFLDAIITSLSSLKPDEGPFDLQLGDLDWVSNEEGNRWFLILRVERPEGDILNKLLKRCNEVCAKFGLPLLYSKNRQCNSEKPNGRKEAGRPGVYGKDKHRENAKKVEEEDFSNMFHFSIAWTLREPKSQDLQELASTNDEKVRQLKEDVRNIKVKFDTIKVKIGNNVTSIDLSTKKVAGKGILG